MGTATAATNNSSMQTRYANPWILSASPERKMMDVREGNLAKYRVFVGVPVFLSFCVDMTTKRCARARRPARVVNPRHDRMHLPMLSVPLAHIFQESQLAAAIDARPCVAGDTAAGEAAADV